MIYELICLLKHYVLQEFQIDKYSLNINMSVHYYMLGEKEYSVELLRSAILASSFSCRDRTYKFPTVCITQHL